VTESNGAPGAAVAVAPERKPGVRLGGLQSDLDELFRLCKALSMAQLLPQALRGKPSDVLIIVLYGQELGLSPIQSIQAIYVVNGKPQLAGQLWLAKLTEAGHEYEIVHGQGSCTVTITRGDNGRSHTETFTLDDAKRANLAGKDIWKSYPKRMLMWRAVSDCASVICPDVALGFGIAEVAQDNAESELPRRATFAEIVGQRHGQPEPTPQQVADIVDAQLAEQPAAQPDEPVDVTHAGVVVEEQPPAADPAEYAALAEEHTAPAAAEPELTEAEQVAVDFWGDQAAVPEEKKPRGRR
jgi:hypothetical protein